jgi:predicted ATP-grasp superfamily ATP-dependent carboligase
MIENLSQLKVFLSNDQGLWAWVGQRGIDAFAVVDFAPVEAVFCCDYGEDYSRFWRRESLFSVEKETGQRENWGNQDLERLWEGGVGERIETYIDNINTPINTVCYRSLEALENDRRFRVLAPPKALKDIFDDKLYQLELFAKLGIKTPMTFSCRLGETSFTNAGDILDGPFVIQPPVGSSGENTYIVQDRVEFDRVRDIFGLAQRVKVSKYLSVPSLNGHCVVLHTRKGLRAIAACPSIQIVGPQECSNRPEIYCGNDFSAADEIPEALREKTCTIMENVGLYMGRKGFLGIFGMDFLLVDGEVMALEINPRFQGSTMLLSLLQLERGEVPLVALHVMQFMGQTEVFSPTCLMQLEDSYRIPYSGAHLIVHNLADATCRVEHALTAGIHTLKNDNVEKVRDGASCCDVKSVSEWCLLGNLPIPGTIIHQQARLAMVHTGGRVLDSSLQQLSSPAASFVNKLQNSFKMISFEGGNG